MKIYSLIFSILLSVTMLAQSNVPAQPELESGSIESQFDYIIEKSSSFKEFQLIRRTSILKVKSNALDSLKALKNKSVGIVTENKELAQKINTLNSEITNLKEEITSLQEDTNSINLFGKNIEKSLYNTFLWSVIIVLLILLVFFVYRFKSSSSVTKRTKKELSTIEKEYEEHRKKSLKKEQEIMRKLQDEINKNNM